MTPKQAYDHGRLTGYQEAFDQLMIPQQRQDVLDGAALRRLREALPGGYAWGLWPFGSGWRVQVMPPPGMFTVDPFDGTTIAEAAGKCREALG